MLTVALWILAFTVLACIICIYTVSWTACGRTIYLRHYVHALMVRYKRSRGRSTFDTERGVRLLRLIIDIGKEANVPIYLSEGTALGAVRENGFIADDTDIDLGVLEEDYERYKTLVIPALLKQGFHMYKSRPYFQTFFKDGEFVDIHAWAKGAPCADIPGPCDEVSPTLRPFQHVTIAGLDAQCPSNEYLELLYGKDWKTPKRRFKPTMIPR